MSVGRTGNRLQSSGLLADAYDLVDATFGVRTERYEFALIGNNLGDERGPTFIGNGGPTSGGDPRRARWSLRIRANFQ